MLMPILPIVAKLPIIKAFVATDNPPPRFKSAILFVGGLESGAVQAANND